jgi:hypothetical protein
MDKIGKGIVAGFLATFALSFLLDPMAMVARTAGVLSPTLGWTLHFLIGSVIWGAGFALVHDLLRGPSWLRGIVFGVVSWIVVVVAILPLTRWGLLGINFGLGASVAMLLVHMIYGTVLGGIYGALAIPSENEPRRRTHSRHELHPLPR